MGRLELSLRRRFAVILLVLAVATGATYVLLDRPPLGIDDAYIFFAYAQNVSHGHGLVYNPGGERVEGFSSPLWMGIVTLAHLVSEKPARLLFVTELVANALALSLLWRFVDNGNRLSWAGLLVVMWSLTSPAYITWMTFPVMDTALWSVMIVIASITALSARSANSLALMVSLLTLTRPEGFLWSLVLVAVSILVRAPREGLSRAIRSASKPITAFLLTVIILVTARLYYFGYLLPNTFYAKVSPDLVFNLAQGGVYLYKFIQAYPLVLFLGLALSVAILIVDGPKLAGSIVRHSPPDAEQVERATLVATSAIVTIGFMIPVLPGGDHFALFRFYQPIWPIILLPFILFVRFKDAESRVRSRGFFSVGLLLVVLVTSQAPWLWRDDLKNFHHEFEIAKKGRTLGTTLNGFTPRKNSYPTVGVITAGGIATTYDGPIIDVMGLNNVAVAHYHGPRYGVKNHAAFSEDVFFRQRPILFLPELPSLESEPKDLCPELFGKTVTWPNSVLGGLLEKKRFWQEYDRVTISNGQQQILTYIRTDTVSGFEDAGYDIESAECMEKYRSYFVNYNYEE